jgi:hypothetical protein
MSRSGEGAYRVNLPNLHSRPCKEREREGLLSSLYTPACESWASRRVDGEMVR